MKVGYRKADIVVAGGGVAGFTAAVAAARIGAEVLLVEKNGYLGGMFTGGNMTVLNCYPACGIGRDIVDALSEQGYARFCPDDPPNYPILHYNSEYCTVTVAYDAEMAKIQLFRMAEDAGVKLMLHSFITGALVEDGRVRGIVVENKSGRQMIEGNVVLDCTADADVAASAGVPFVMGQTEERVLFAMTMLVRLSHVDWSRVSEYSKTDSGLDKVIERGIASEELPYYKPRSLEMANYWGHPRPELSHLLHEDECLLWGGTVEGMDGTKVEDLTRAEVEARKQYMSELNFLRKNVPGFEQARIEGTGHSVGVRDTRHIVGEYTITGEDLLERRNFPDGVAYNVKGGYPVNTLPYRSLLPREVEGLLVAGNCLSVVPGSTKMGLQIGSFNNLKDIPTMWTTGEAAGMAAALSVSQSLLPRDLDVENLKRALTDQGALLSDGRIRELESKTLPSGATVKEHYEERLDREKSYWGQRGELLPT